VCRVTLLMPGLALTAGTQHRSPYFKSLEVGVINLQPPGPLRK
jgi:hypothetical protein